MKLKSHSRWKKNSMLKMCRLIAGSFCWAAPFSLETFIHDHHQRLRFLSHSGHKAWGTGVYHLELLSSFEGRYFQVLSPLFVLNCFSFTQKHCIYLDFCVTGRLYHITFFHELNWRHFDVTQTSILLREYVWYHTTWLSITWQESMQFFAVP